MKKTPLLWYPQIKPYFIFSYVTYLKNLMCLVRVAESF